eukprot:2939225-Prymnesium_polylepis.1
MGETNCIEIMRCEVNTFTETVIHLLVNHSASGNTNLKRERSSIRMSAYSDVHGWSERTGPLYRRV